MQNKMKDAKANIKKVLTHKVFANDYINDKNREAVLKLKAQAFYILGAIEYEQDNIEMSA